MAIHKSDMTTYTSIELRLLLAAEAADLPLILDIIGRLTLDERGTVGSKVYDTALYSIVNYAAVDRAESAYATMMFIRAVGRYISPEAVSASLQSTPPEPQIYTDNVHQLHTQPATNKLCGASLLRQAPDHERR